MHCVLTISRLTLTPWTHTFRSTASTKTPWTAITNHLRLHRPRCDRTKSTESGLFTRSSPYRRCCRPLRIKRMQCRNALKRPFTASKGTKWASTECTAMWVVTAWCTGTQCSCRCLHCLYRKTASPQPLSFRRPSSPKPPPRVLVSSTALPLRCEHTDRRPPRPLHSLCTLRCSTPSARTTIRRSSPSRRSLITATSLSLRPSHRIRSRTPPHSPSRSQLRCPQCSTFNVQCFQTLYFTVPHPL